MDKKKTYDAGIGWVSSVENVFLSFLKKELRKKKYSFDEVTYENLRHRYDDIKNDRYAYRVFIDRASFDHPAYFLFADLVQKKGAYVVNNPDAVIAWGSKTALYGALCNAGLPLPRVFLLPARPPAKKELIHIPKALGVPFILKPAYGGLVDDVLLRARTVDDIITFMEDNGTDETLAQEYVVPTVVRKKTAWFRPLYVCGEVIPLWWDPLSHFYQPFGRSAEERDIAKDLKNMLCRIHDITGLDLFTTEVAIDEGGEYKIIDYANHPIDLNSQENASDALPEDILEDVARCIAVYIGKIKAHGNVIRE
ncbi:MAG: hypothetical protein COU90_02750 [Candidatus Ryanbacteria bacterium CG10_big_fil_rev_8_21_14_0_10_43_42]|uniref:ATP-grasp domain-containing protein n=1 Tax=Candidatus Ryanbacteria bacterium CG10_big_fil_rev_8_21_14_0_10_43_42 TaxID=1974864 RepID=A0A2M8KWP5_9BACT|nr:MAG: hypothetical protein COU90_02750 [Candidatus Ryanbacteria bacterium CG10_big_fil_rev_8_21_14_0_10_43_42]